MVECDICKCRFRVDQVESPTPVRRSNLGDFMDKQDAIIGSDRLLVGGFSPTM